MESTPSSKKPCDQCTRRKVRCNYEIPCVRCVDTGLECTHSIVRKKRGPRRGRGAVLDTLRSGNAPVSPGESVLQFPGKIEDHSQFAQNTPSSLTSAPLALQQPLPVGLDAGQIQPPGLSLDEFLSFDEFTQNVLANPNFLPEDLAADPVQVPSQVDSGLSNENINLPGSNGGPTTPFTSLTAGAAVPELVDDFEITPLVEHGVDLFFVHIHPIYPLLSKETLQLWLQNPTLLSQSEQTLIWAICATTLAIVDGWPSLSYEQRAISARRFVRQILLLRTGWDYMEDPCFEDVLTSLFVANTFFDLKCRKASWMHVREAISLAVAAEFHNDSAYIGLSEAAQLIRRRTYALLYITERGAAIQDGFPVSILLPPPLEERSLPTEEPTLAHGLSALHALFSLLDFKFVKLWNDPGNAAFASSGRSDLFLLQSHLRDLRIEENGLSEVQRADLLVTQQWLRLIFWQAALRQGYISTTAEDPAFSYNFPVDVAMEMCQVVKNLPPVAIQAHGLGIFEKQFEVAYSLMDALALAGTSQPEHHECLRYLLLSLSASPNSRQLFVRTLESKMGSQQKYRSLTGVELFRDDRGSRQNSRRPSRVPAPK